MFSVVDKKACLDGWGGYFSRKRLALMAGVRISRLEKYASIYWIFIVVYVFDLTAMDGRIEVASKKYMTSFYIYR